MKPNARRLKPDARTYHPPPLHPRPRPGRRLPRGHERQALRLGVTGWVRNRHDGSVEAIVQGTQAQVDELLRWLHRGPPTAMVLRVEVGTAEGHFDRFERRPTA